MPNSQNSMSSSSQSSTISTSTKQDLKGATMLIMQFLDPNPKIPKESIYRFRYVKELAAAPLRRKEERADLISSLFMNTPDCFNEPIFAPYQWPYKILCSGLVDLFTAEEKEPKNSNIRKEISALLITFMETKVWANNINNDIRYSCEFVGKTFSFKSTKLLIISCLSFCLKTLKDLLTQSTISNYQHCFHNNIKCLSTVNEIILWPNELIADMTVIKVLMDRNNDTTKLQEQMDKLVNLCDYLIFAIPTNAKANGLDLLTRQVTRDMLEKGIKLYASGNFDKVKAMDLMSDILKTLNDCDNSNPIILLLLEISLRIRDYLWNHQPDPTNSERTSLVEIPSTDESTTTTSLFDETPSSPDSYVEHSPEINQRKSLFDDEPALKRSVLWSNSSEHEDDTETLSLSLAKVSLPFLGAPKINSRFDNKTSAFRPKMWNHKTTTLLDHISESMSHFIKEGLTENYQKLNAIYYMFSSESERKEYLEKIMSKVDPLKPLSDKDFNEVVNLTCKHFDENNRQNSDYYWNLLSSTTKCEQQSDESLEKFFKRLFEWSRLSNPADPDNEDMKVNLKRKIFLGLKDKTIVKEILRQENGYELVFEKGSVSELIDLILDIKFRRSKLKDNSKERGLLPKPDSQIFSPNKTKGIKSAKSKKLVSKEEFFSLVDIEIRKKSKDANVSKNGRLITPLRDIPLWIRTKPGFVARNWQSDRTKFRKVNQEAYSMICKKFYFDKPN